jgi:peptidyl-prolyl cis-trans isomerase A (cyclophilin A)
MKRFMLLLALLLMVSFFPRALFGQAESAAPQPATATHPRTTHMTTDPALLHPATLTAQAPDVYEVKFETTKGDFVVQVTRAWAPIGADRFYNLVEHHFYNGVAFFRVVPNFVVQFGLGPDPTVNKAWQNANIKDDRVTQSNRPGTITFATAGPNTRTCQVFINFGNNAFLDNQGFAPFGQVTSGMDVVNHLYSGYADSPTSHQSEITYEGKAYLDKNFPKLDSIKSATIISPSGTAPKP